MLLRTEPIEKLEIRRALDHATLATRSVGFHNLHPQQNEDHTGFMTMQRDKTNAQLEMMQLLTRIYPIDLSLALVVGTNSLPVVNAKRVKILSLTEATPLTPEEMPGELDYLHRGQELVLDDFEVIHRFSSDNRTLYIGNRELGQHVCFDQLANALDSPDPARLVLTKIQD